MHENETLCTKLGIYKTHEQLPSFSGIWYLSSNINLVYRTQLNKRIVELREEGKIEKIVGDWAGGPAIPKRCLNHHNIDVVTLSVPLLLIVGPFIIYLLLHTAVYTIKTLCFTR